MTMKVEETFYRTRVITFEVPKPHSLEPMKRRENRRDADDWSFLPQELSFYITKEDEKPVWVDDITLKGQRLLKDGTLGRKVVVDYYSSHSMLPRWAQEVIEGAMSAAERDWKK